MRSAAIRGNTPFVGRSTDSISGRRRSNVSSPVLLYPPTLDDGPVKAKPAEHVLCGPARDPDAGCAVNTYEHGTDMPVNAACPGRFCLSSA